MGYFLPTVFLFINCASFAFSAGGSDWDYDRSGSKGPANWKLICATGKKQSPIDIKSAKATYDKNLGAFQLKNYDTKPNVNFSIDNNGLGLKVGFSDGDYEVSKGGLPGVFKTVQFHFHWGTNNAVGSEHTVNEKKYPAEFHFVSFNKKYANLSEAVGHGDGLAVLGVLIEVGGEDNPAFSFLQHAKDLAVGGNTSYIPSFKFINLLPANKTAYFRYSGSLTTPTCNEVVTWTVFNDAVKISESQIKLMRGLKKADGSSLGDTYRPVQDLNDREVKASFQTVKALQAGASALSITAGLFLSMLFAAFSMY